ncbi:MAG: hypothetical protein IT430_19335 [Phycisphaerales bacterium]|nr:hypothetical protein [Phycisphaerales bacterium]
MTGPSIHLPVLRRHECGEHADAAAAHEAPQFWRSLAELEDANWALHRFNFLLYNDWDDSLAAMRHNPNVSVRSRGVMEKCTYCVQRIRSAEIEARKDNRSIRDGEVVTACQAVCPTQAIIFGNLRDQNSAVSRTKAQPHDYALLEELNTRPRTTYLARVRNPNSVGQTGGENGR